MNAFLNGFQVGGNKLVVCEPPAHHTKLFCGIALNAHPLNQILHAFTAILTGLCKAFVVIQNISRFN